MPRFPAEVNGIKQLKVSFNDSLIIQQIFKFTLGPTFNLAFVSYLTMLSNYKNKEAKLVMAKPTQLMMYTFELTLWRLQGIPLDKSQSVLPTIYMDMQHRFNLFPVLSALPTNPRMAVYTLLLFLIPYPTTFPLPPASSWNSCSQKVVHF